MADNPLYPQRDLSPSGRVHHRFSATKRTWGRALIILVGVVAAHLNLYILAEHVGISGPVLLILNLALRTIFWFLLARAARIRLLTGNQTVIPNEEMARLDIENIGRRPHIRRQSNIGITYNTPLEKVERAVQIIEEILANHEGMDPQLPPKVFFNEFNFAFPTTTNYLTQADGQPLHINLANELQLNNQIGLRQQ